MSVPRKFLQKVIIAASLVAAAIGLTSFVLFRVRHQAVPRWDIVAMSYGLIFAFFLFLDWFSKQAVQARSEAEVTRSSGRRPVPVSADRAEQRATAAPTAAARPADVRLERTRSDDYDKLTRLLAAAIPEVLALEWEAAAPEVSRDAGAADSAPARKAASVAKTWMDDPGIFPFFIVYRDQSVGCCALRTQGSRVSLNFVYVQSQLRRRNVATYGLGKLLEFAALMGLEEEMTAVVSSSNARGQSFLSSLGFRKAAQELRTELETELRTELRGQGDLSSYESLVDEPLAYEPARERQQVWVKRNPTH